MHAAVLSSSWFPRWHPLVLAPQETLFETDFGFWRSRSRILGFSHDRIDPEYGKRDQP